MKYLILENHMAKETANASDLLFMALKASCDASGESTEFFKVPYNNTTVEFYLSNIEEGTGIEQDIEQYLECRVLGEGTLREYIFSNLESLIDSRYSPLFKFVDNEFELINI